MPASPDRQWSTEEDNLIRSLVLQGTQLKDMPPSLPKRTLRAIQCRVYTLGLKSGRPRTRHSKNETFWETPNTLNSYYAGLMAADGSVGGYREVLQWTCESADRSSMEAFIRATRFTGRMTETLMHHPAGNTSIHCRVFVSACQKWNADLARNFNVVPQKVHRLAPPTFQSDLLACCYLIGYTDGDGCISILKSNTDSPMPVLSYTSASKDIVQWVRDFVDLKFPFSNRRNPKRAVIGSSPEQSYHHCRIYGLQAIKLFDFLRRIDVPHFARKWDNPAFLALVETYRQKWPEFFASDKELAFDPAGNIVFAASLPPQIALPAPIYP